MDTRALTISRPPTVTIWANPFEPVGNAVPASVEVGTPIAELLPEALERYQVACRVNGNWISRADWRWPAIEGDVIEFHVRVNGGGNGLRMALQIAAMIAINTFMPGSGWWVAARIGATLASSYIINDIFGPGGTAKSGASSQTTQTAYSTSLQGNEVDIGGPIPVLFGYTKTTPKFASQPYVEYDESGDQYFHALYIIGEGQYALKRMLIGKTAVDAFDDVQTEWLEPGQAPTLVNPAVSTSAEVSGQDLLTDKKVGGFVANRAGLNAVAIGLDFYSPALGIADSAGNMSARTVTVRIDTREVDDFGRGVSAWQVLATENITAATTSPVRRSYKYVLPTPARVMVRVIRLDAKSDNSNNYDDMQWTGLRAYLEEAAPLCAYATHAAVRIRANEQLSGLSQNQFGVITVRKLRAWSLNTGWSTDLVETRSIAWALAEKWSNTFTGDGLADYEMDLATLAYYDAVWEARQDRFDYAFDQSTDSDSADQLIATAGRARVFTRMGVRTLVRDEKVTLPVAAFSARNIEAGQWTIQTSCPTSQSADGIRLMYTDNRSWQQESIDCPVPGVEVMSRPEVVEIKGVTGVTHATREGRFLAACLLYRRDVTEWRTELQGTIPAYGSPVRFQAPMSGWGQTGDVVDWDPATLRATLSEPLTWAEGAHYISIIGDLGDVSGAILATPGATAYEVVLDAEPDVDITTGEPDRERPVYLFGTASELATTVRIRSISPEERDSDGPQLISIKGVIEDNRVHQADVSLLPTEGTQDPVDDGGGADGSGGILLISRAIGPASAIWLLNYLRASTFKLGASGHASTSYRNSDGSIVNTALPSEWASGATMTAEQAAQYEARATIVGRSGTYDGHAIDLALVDAFIAACGIGSARDVWLGLGEERSWGFDVGSYSMGEYARWVTVVLRIRIRNVSDGIEQASADITMRFLVG